jgi:CBS domain-containing protein
MRPTAGAAPNVIAGTSRKLYMEYLKGILEMRAAQSYLAQSSGSEHKHFTMLSEVKCPPIHTVNENESLYSAAQKMCERNVSALVITGDDEAAVGLFTERDFVASTMVGMSMTLKEAGCVGDVVTACSKETVDRCLSKVSSVHSRLASGRAFV